MKENISLKLLYLITTLLIITVLIISTAFPFKNALYLFFFVFGIASWQKERLKDFFQKIKNPKVAVALYFLTGWAWMIFFEYQLGRLPFHPKPPVDIIIGLGFYLPYFILWLKLINRYQFNFLEVFYLAGLGRLIFDFFITRKILTAAAVTTSALTAFLVVIVQALITLVLFGALTALPTLYLINQEDKHYNKPLKHYLFGLTTGFLAAGALILWATILKIIFRT
ncbi:hypothetical protein ISS85_02020 [Candidatus Microgenomates bacterium]|nr:hypothetical protein [Candidatus Microgenomates bacterium]